MLRPLDSANRDCCPRPLRWVAILGLLSSAQAFVISSGAPDGEGFAYAIRHHTALTSTLGIKLTRPPSDSAFGTFFDQVGVAALCAAIHDWRIARIPVRAESFDQLIFDGRALRGSVEPTAGGESTFIAQVTRYSAALGLAISQACYATGENHKRAVLKQLLGELDLQGLLFQADALHTQKPFVDNCRSRGLNSSLRSKPTSGPRIDRSHGHSRGDPRSFFLQWIRRSLNIGTTPGRCERKRRLSTSVRNGAAQAGSLKSSPRECATASRSTPSTCFSTTSAQPQKVCYHSPETVGGLRGGTGFATPTSLHVDVHRYRGNGSGVMGSLRPAAL